MNRLFDHIPIISERFPGKIILSFLMFIFSIVIFFIWPSLERFICFAAVFFSFLGDIMLNSKRDHNLQTDSDVLFGGIAFIFAHIFFCGAYLSEILLYRKRFSIYGPILALVILISITAFMLYKKKRDERTKLFYFGIAYLWLTGINYSTVFAYAFSVKSIKSLCMLGGLMFLASDVIIGCEKFLGLRSKLARELVWWLYPIGQILLIIMV